MDPVDSPGPGRVVHDPREPAWLERARRVTRLDLRPGTPPSALRWTIATLVSVGLSLALCALAVEVATRLFPSTRGFPHFRIADYGTLTVVGVLLAAAGWAALVRLSSAARWAYLRLAVAVTLVLWLPDVWLFLRGENSKAVVTLMVMHLLIAFVTYNVLVRGAPAGAPPAIGTGAGGTLPSAPLHLSDRAVRRIWSAQALLVAIELGLGVAVIVAVPFRRPAAVIPARGTLVYAAHGAVGIALGVGALAVLVLAPLAGRMGRIGAVVGTVGVGIGLAGGVCSTFQQTRLLGMGVMLLGVVVAAVGYLAPTLEALGRAEAERAEAARAAMAAKRARTGDVPPGVPEPGDAISSNGHAASNGHASPPR